jgi:hypothetical protein
MTQTAVRRQTPRAVQLSQDDVGRLEGASQVYLSASCAPGPQPSALREVLLKL